MNVGWPWRDICCSRSAGSCEKMHESPAKQLPCTKYLINVSTMSDCCASLNLLAKMLRKVMAEFAVGT